MMTNLELLMLYGLQLLITVLLAACTWHCIRLRLEVAQQGAATQRPPPATVEQFDDRELRRMFDRRLTILEERLLHTVRQQQKPVPLSPQAPVPPLKNELPVEYAVRMARSGAGVNDLVQGCGLNIGEAQLLLRLHSNTRKPATAVTH
jgi:hypothetical protein